MSDTFYRALEDKYRGPRELIKSRLTVYLPFITPLLMLYQNPSAIDLGCGRGEWLELLRDAGFDGYGVDLDNAMLAACRELQLAVDAVDAIQALEALGSESRTVVSGFHIAEHIPFPQLQKLVQEAFRVLTPAGLLILETPNPENIVVGTANFYIDPTHRQPIPPNLLSFLPEFYGFIRTKVIRLRESPLLLDSPCSTLKDVLEGVSSDFAIVAQKSAQKKSLEPFDQAFDKEYGVTLQQLVDKYDSTGTQVQATLAAACASVMEAAVRDATDAQVRATLAAEAAERAAADAQVRATLAEHQAAEASAEKHAALERCAVLEERTAAAEARSEELSRWLNAIYRSTSWRATAPLRVVSSAHRWILRDPKSFARGVRAWVMLKRGSRPRRALRWATTTVRGSTLTRPQPAPQVIEPPLPQSLVHASASVHDVTDLSPRTRALYDMLNRIATKQRETP